MRNCSFYVMMLTDFTRGSDLKKDRVYGLNNEQFVQNLLNRGYARYATKEEIASRNDS